MTHEQMKRAMIDARWDKSNRRRESLRAVMAVGLIVAVVFIALVGYGVINNL